MNFDEIEDLWNMPQQPAASISADATVLARQLVPELRRRSRFFGYEIFCLALGLVLTPLLAVANALHRHPENPLFYWLRAAVFTTIIAAFLVGTIRRFRRHRALAASHADSLGAASAKALAQVEAEICDHRRGLLALPLWFLLTLASIEANVPVAVHGWGPLGLRAGLAFVFCVAVGAGFTWNWQTNLVPERERRRRLVADLSS